MNRRAFLFSLSGVVLVVALATIAVYFHYIPVPYKGMMMQVDSVSYKYVSGEDALSQGDGAKRYDFTYSYQGRPMGSTWTVAPRDDSWGVSTGDTFAWVLDLRMTWLRHELRFSPTVFLKGDIWDPVKVDMSYSVDEIPL